MAKHCINLSLPEINKQFYELQESGLFNPKILLAKIAIWQEDNNKMEIIPTAKELNLEIIPISKVNEILGTSYRKNLNPGRLVDIKEKISKVNNDNFKNGINEVYFLNTEKIGESDLVNWKLIKSKGELDIDAKIERAESKTPDPSQNKTKIDELKKLKNQAKPGEQGTLFQTESKGTPNEALDNIIKIFLSKANFNVEEVFDEIKTQTGEDATASVDLFNRLIKISKNKQGEDTLTEEASHVLEAMLGKDHPLYQKMFDLIEQTEVWENTLSEYNTVYDGNLDKIKFEAIGKMITKVAIQKFKKNELNTTSNTVWDKFSKLVQAAFKWLNNKFKNVPDTFESEIEKVYGEAADMLLTGNVPQVKSTEIKPGVEELFESKRSFADYSDFGKTLSEQEIINLKKEGNKVTAKQFLESIIPVNDFEKKLKSFLLSIDLNKLNGFDFVINDKYQGNIIGLNERNLFEKPTVIFNSKSTTKPSRYKLHEFLHSLLDTVVNEEQEFRTELITLFDYVKTLPEFKNEYGVIGWWEFYTEGMTNPDFQAKLKNVTLSGYKGGKKSNVYEEFVKIINGILEKLGFVNKDYSALNEIINATTKVIEKRYGYGIKPGVQELFDSNPELAAIGTSKQYSQYLDTIFPDSQVKDIVYHQGKTDFEKFDLSKATESPVIYFSFYKPTSNIFGDKNKSLLVNFKNPFVEEDRLQYDSLEQKYKNKFVQDGYDAIITPNDIGIAFEPEQIHILGSKQDIEGFKEFVNNQTFFQLDSDKKKYGDFIVDKGFPIQVSNLEKIQFGEKRLSVRPNLYADGVYKLGNYFYQIRKIKPNKALYSEFKSGNFLKEKAFGSEEIKYQHIKDFFDNKTPMYVYSIMKLDSDIQMLYQAEEVKKKKAVYKDAIQEQIERSEIKIQRIKKQTPNWKNNPKASVAISKLEEYIKNLKEDRALSLIENKANNELNAIEAKLEDLDNIADKEGFFTYALDTLKGWQDLDEFITYPEDKEGKQRIIAMTGRANNLEKVLMNKFQDFASEEYGEDFNSSIVDESFFGANFLDIAQSKIPILKKIGEFINRARFVAYELTKQLETKTNEEFDLLKKWSGYTNDKALWDLFRQKDSKGNWTGNYVAEISNSFYEKKAELAKWAKENKSFSAYYRWLNANTDKVFDKEAFDAMYEQVRATEFTLPDGTIDEAGLQAWAAKNGENANGGPFIKYNPKVELWKDKQYEYIQSVPELKRFYDFFINTLEERESVLPSYEKKQSNYLPELRRNTFLDFSKGGMTGLLKEWTNQFKDSFANDIESSKETVLRDPITGEPEKTLPVYMIADRLNPEDKEYDLTKILKSFGAMSYMYEQKNAIEEPVKLMSSLFRNLKEKLTAEGIDKSDRFGKLVEILDGNKQAVSMMDYHIDALMYDRTREDDTTKKLGEVTVDGETKKVTTGSIIDWLINYTRIKGLSLNIFSGVTNVLFGVSSNFIHAEGKKDFTPQQATDAFGIMLNAVVKGSDTNKKVNFLMDKFRIKPEAVSSEGANISKYLYVFTEAGEYINYGQTGIATLLNTKVKNLKGETKDLYDAYIIQNGKVVWNTKEFGPEQYSDLSEEKYNLATKIQGLNKRIHGNYDPESPIKIKSHVWGRAVMIFRSWLPMAIYTRFGSVNMSKELSRETKGRYITGWEYTKQNKFGVLLPVFKELMTQVINTSTLNRLQLESGAFNEMSELDRENMLRNVAELRYILFFMALGTILRGMTIDDEDEEKVALTKFIINQTDRVEGELSFFFSPTDQSRIIRDITPVSRTFSDFYDLVPATTKLIMGEDELKSGPNKGKSNFYRQLKQAVPVVAQVQKIIELPDKNIDNPMFR